MAGSEEGEEEDSWGVSRESVDPRLVALHGCVSGRDVAALSYEPQQQLVAFGALPHAASPRWPLASPAQLTRAPCAQRWRTAA